MARTISSVPSIYRVTLPSSPTVSAAVSRSERCSPASVHIVTTSRRYKDRVYTTHLLRRSYREGGKVKNQTVGNLSHLPDPVIEMIRQALGGRRLVPAGDAL